MNVWLKRVGYTIGAIIALLLIIVSFVYGESRSQPGRRHVTPPAASAATSSAR